MEPDRLVKVRLADAHSEVQAAGAAGEPVWARTASVFVRPAALGYPIHAQRRVMP